MISMALCLCSLLYISAPSELVQKREGGIWLGRAWTLYSPVNLWLCLPASQPHYSNLLKAVTLQEGTKAESFSHEDYLNGPGETVSSKFTTPGEYSYYCEPHQGAGMGGKIIVQ